MITSALLFAVGFVLGLRFRFMVIFIGSILVAIAYAALFLRPTDIDLLPLLILIAHITALQAGYLLGLFIDSTRSRPPH